MIFDHICDGDYVVIRKQNTCENGDIIVASHLPSLSHSSFSIYHPSLAKNLANSQNISYAYI